MMNRKEPNHARSKTNNEAALRPRPSTSDWAAAIQQVWAAGGANTLELARVVHEARSRLARGEWSALWCSGQIGFSKRKAEMLAAVGAGLGRLNAQNSALLRRSWSTLYYLARLGGTVLEGLLNEGKIHPQLKLCKAKALVAQGMGRPAADKSDHLRVLPFLKRLATLVTETLPEWSAAERRLAASRVRKILFEIEVGSTGRPGRVFCPDMDTTGHVVAPPRNDRINGRGLGDVSVPIFFVNSLQRSTE